MLEKEVLFFDPWSAIVQTIFSCKSLDLAKAEYQSGFFWPGNLMLFVAEREGELSFVVLELMNSFIFVFEIGFNLQKGKKGHREKHCLTVPASYSRCHPSKRLPVKAAAGSSIASIWKSFRFIVIISTERLRWLQMILCKTWFFKAFPVKGRGTWLQLTPKKVIFSLYF